MNLQESALNIALHASQWTARKFDKKVTAEIAANHNTDETWGRANKNLFLSDADTYKEIGRLISVARQHYYENTLPWDDDNWRIITAVNYQIFAKIHREDASNFRMALPLFYEQYGFYKAAAKARRNGLYREEDYPTIEKLKKKFKIELEVQPIPSAGDFRVKIQAQDAAEITAQIERNNKEKLSRSMEEPFKRLFDGVAHMAARLGTNKVCMCRACKGKEFKSAEFSDSLIDNLTALCEVLPRLNLTGDTALDDVIEEVKAGLTAFTPGAVRANDAIKDTLAERAAEIQNNLAAFFGKAA